MKLSSKMVYDEALNAKQRDKTLRQLQRHKKIKNMHLILRIDQNPNLLHIVDGKEFERMKKRELKVAVVGMAKDAESAVLLIQSIVEQMVKDHQDVNGVLLDEEFDIKWES